MDKQLSPKEFLKKRRPESFSDSEAIEYPILDRSFLEYFLDTLTSRNQEVPFENFARELAKREICPNILPHTGPTGGGDSKVDAETYPVADDLSFTWHIGADRKAASERWAFAFSTKEDWRAKVQSDISKIAATNRGYTKAFFISNQFVRDKVRAELEDTMRQKHGIDVRILDRTWILDRVFTSKHEELAVNELGVQAPKPVQVKKGPLDTQRERLLVELEKTIADATQQGHYTLQLVDDCISAAKLARNMELARTQVEGLLLRAERVASEYGTSHQKLVAAYERASTAFWYFEDYKGFADLYPPVEALAKGTVNAYDLELLGNLWLLLRTAISRRWIDSMEVEFEKKTIAVTTELERLSRDTARPSTALQARTMLLHHILISTPADQAAPILEEFREVIVQSNGLVGYPLRPYVDIVQSLGTLFKDCPAYDRLFEAIVDVMTKHDGDIAAARLLATRGDQHLNAGKNYEAIRVFGRALSRLFKHESRHDLVRALYLCGVAYERVGLLWAARGVTLAAAGIAINEFWTHSEVTELQEACYSRLKRIELRLGRLPQILTWHEIDLATRATLNHRQKSAKMDHENQVDFDATLGILLLRSDLRQLNVLCKLPDVLDDLQLHLSSAALRYALGHQHELPQDLVSDTPLEFFRKWVEHPASQIIAQCPVLYDGDTVALRSNVAGCVITIQATMVSPCIEVAESILAAIESLLSTALSDGARAREPILTIHVTAADVSDLISFSANDREGRPHIDVGCALFNAHKVDSADQEKIKSKISDLILHALVRVYLINNPRKMLIKLFRDEQAIDRAVNFTSSFVVAGNVLGDNPKTTWASWCPPDAKEYPLTRVAEWFTEIRRDAESAADHSEAGAPEASRGESDEERLDLENLKHTDIETVSLIREALWNRAGWFATAFFSILNSRQPPVLALVFKDGAVATEIFTALRKDVGRIDENEILRISIIRGIKKDSPYAYTVLVGTNLPVEKVPESKLVIMVARKNAMNPESSVNLSRFLDAYERAGGYFLMPATWPAGGHLELIRENYIAKRELNIREAWQIGRHDPDAAGINDDDDPIIPTDKGSAPILDLLQWQRRDRD